VLLPLLALAQFARSDTPLNTVEELLSESSPLGTIEALLDLIDKDAVREAQATYNFHLDKLFDISCTNNQTLVNAYVNDVMLSYCPDPVFTSWTAATPGVDPTTGKVTQLTNTPPAATTFAGVRNTYIGIVNGHTFGCFSQHNVMNSIVSFSTDSHGRRTAKFTARLVQNALLGQYNLFADIYGYYQNTWTKLNNNWCLSKFFSANEAIVVRDLPNAQGQPLDTNVFAFDYGTDQLPLLP